MLPMVMDIFNLFHSNSVSGAQTQAVTSVLITYSSKAAQKHSVRTSAEMCAHWLRNKAITLLAEALATNFD